MKVLIFTALIISVVFICAASANGHHKRKIHHDKHHVIKHSKHLKEHHQPNGEDHQNKHQHTQTHSLQHSKHQRHQQADSTGMMKHGDKHTHMLVDKKTKNTKHVDDNEHSLTPIKQQQHHGHRPSKNLTKRSRRARKSGHKGSKKVHGQHLKSAAKHIKKSTYDRQH